MWQDPSNGNDGCQKKCFRQMTIAQAFKRYNKKLKVELDQGSPSTSSFVPQPQSDASCARDHLHGKETDMEVIVVDSVYDADHKRSLVGEHGLRSSTRLNRDDFSDLNESEDCLVERANPEDAKQLHVITKSVLEESQDVGKEPSKIGNEEFSVVDISQTSLDLFPNLGDDSNSSSGESTDIVSDHESSFDLLSFVTSLTSQPELGRLKPACNHTVLFNCSFKVGEMPEPYPKDYVDAWDADHIRLPYSRSNVYPTQMPTGERVIRNRWEMITESFSRPIAVSTHLEEAILRYNSQYSKRWNFRSLHSFFTEAVEPEEADLFFGQLLPEIVRLALDLPIVCTQPIPLLKRHTEHSITLSQKQIACLLANAFLCTFPRRNTVARGSEYEQYPTINFNSLYAHSAKTKHQKIICFLNYFRRVTSSTPTGTVTFRRKCLRQFPNWKDSTKPLKRFLVQSEGTIEREGVGMLQVDFANKFVGGGVLNTGLVQEEIRFLICPELVVSRLFTQCLDENEALLVIGCEQFNLYSGYGDSFAWEDDFKDQTPRDKWGRRLTSIVAIDALQFSNDVSQYRSHYIRREVNKAYCGFYGDGANGNLAAIATGNWGCGVFGGDARLKSLVQYVAASEARRDVAYFTFGDEELAADINNMVVFLRKRCVTVGKLWTLLEGYYEQCVSGRRDILRLYDYIYASFRKADVKCV